MSAITYIAIDRGNLTGGRVAGAAYIFDAPVKSSDPSIAREIKENVSLSGLTETLLHRVDRGKLISTAPIRDADLNGQMIEFIDSVIGGEPFIFDEKGTTLVADNPVTATLGSDPSIQRQGRSDAFTYGFKIKL